MKKLATFAVLLSLAAFSFGCQKADTGAGNGNGAAPTDQAAPADDAGAPAPAEEGSGAAEEGATEGAE